MSGGLLRPGWDLFAGVMCEALQNVTNMLSRKSAAEERGAVLIDAGLAIDAFRDRSRAEHLGALLVHPTAEQFWGCRVHGRWGPCHDCLIEDEFPADEPAPLPPNCVAASAMFPQHTRAAKK